MADPKQLTVTAGPGGTIQPTYTPSGPTITPPAPTTASPTTKSTTPLKSATAAVSQKSAPSQDLSATYALVNGTVINKVTKTPLDLNAFKTETGIQNPNWSALKFDTAYDPTSQNDILNSGQEAALEVLNSTPTKDVAEAQLLVTEAQDRIEADRKALGEIGTGDQDLRVQTENYYKKFEIEKIQGEIEAAQAEYDAVTLEKMDNLSRVEEQYSGTGATNEFAKNVNDKDQRTYAIRQYAAATKLKAMQDKLNSTIDVFKVFVGQAEAQQNNEIRKLATQIGIDENALSVGVTLLDQAKEEAAGDEKEARQMIIDLAKAGVYDSLSTSDKEAIANNQITPTILAAIGTATIKAEEKGVVADLAAKYADAGILLTDSLATAQGKLRNSAIYREQVRPPSSSGMNGDEKAASAVVSVYGSVIDGELANGATPEQAVLTAATVAGNVGPALGLNEQNALLNYARGKQQVNNNAKNQQTAPPPTNTTKPKDNSPRYIGASPAAGSLNFTPIATGISNFFGGFQLDSSGNIKR